MREGYARQRVMESDHKAPTISEQRRKTSPRHARQGGFPRVVWRGPGSGAAKGYPSLADAYKPSAPLRQTAPPQLLGYG